MWPAIRKVIFWTHLAAGLIAAIVVGVMCVTGVLLTYERQTIALFDRWGLHSLPPTPDARPLNMDALIGRVRAQWGVTPETITVRGATSPVQARLKNIGSPYLDAYTGAAIGDESAAVRRFFAAVIRWHTALGVSGPRGRLSHGVVSAANAMFAFLVLCGALLWIPRVWTWRHVRGILLFRRGISGHARDFNWHNAIGVWSVIPLVVIAWTGMAMSYGWAKRMTNRVVGMGNPEWHGKEAELAATGPATLDDLLARAERQSEGWKAITMRVPGSGSSPVDFAIDRSGYNGIGQSAALELDRTGQVVVFTPAGSGGVPAPTFIRFGHTGEAWGVAGQTIAGAVSLGAALLVWTGVALSLRRFRSWRRRRAY